MLKITNIEQQKNNKERYSIFIDNEFAFGLIMDDILFFRLEIGKEISESTYNYLVNTKEILKVQNVALKYLSYKQRTEKEVIKKLKEFGFEEELIYKTISSIKEIGYIDDTKYAQDYIDESIRLKPKGRYRLQYELEERGISKDIIEYALNNSGINEKSSAKLLLLRKVRDVLSIDEKEKKRLFSYLHRRGYCYNTIKEVFYELENEER